MSTNTIEISSSLKDPYLGGSTFNIFVLPVIYLNALLNLSPASCITNGISEVAVKVVRLMTTDNKRITDCLAILRTMMPVWATLDHPNIVPVHGMGTTKQGLPVLLTNWFRNGNILDFRKNLRGDGIKLILWEMAKGMAALHSGGIVHGNFCPTDVLISDDGHAMIANAGIDFRFREIMHGDKVPLPKTWRYKSSRELPFDDVDNISPTFQDDVYIFASVIFHIMTGKAPFARLQYGPGIFKIHSEGHLALAKPAEITEQLWSLMIQCWALEPSGRPTMSVVESTLRELASGV